MKAPRRATPGLEGLAAHLVDAPPSPCEAYACAMRENCAQRGLACDAFVVYVNTSRTMSPFAAVRFSKKRQLMIDEGMRPQILATAKHFGALFREPMAQGAGA